jgi:hypothetical protein
VDEENALAGTLPLAIKVAWTLFLCLLVPVYWARYGPGNFLWFSDIALIVTGLALWLESALLASTMAVGVLLPEGLWMASYFVRLTTGRRVTALADYMFDRNISRFLRGLSLFHLALPPVLLWMVARLGYDDRAVVVQTMLAWIVLPAAYLLTGPSQNVNWVFGPGKPQRWMSPRVWLALSMVFFPVAIYLPTHLVLDAWF